MKKQIVLFVCCVGFFVCGKDIVFAEVVQVDITTPVQVLAPHVISKPIVVEMRNGDKTPEAAQETLDLVFTSTSPTGVFSRETGSTTKFVISKHTMRRTAYYTDSTLGAYTITVRATGRDSKKVFIAKQMVIVAPESTSTAVHQTVSPHVSVEVEKNMQKQKNSSLDQGAVVSTQNNTHTPFVSPQVDQSTTTTVVYTANVTQSKTLTSYIQSIWRWVKRFF